MRRPGKTDCKQATWASKGRSACPGRLKHSDWTWGWRWTAHLVAQARATEVQRQRFFCLVLSLWWHWACLHEGFSSCLFTSSPGSSRGRSWGQWGSCGGQGKAAHLSLWQGLLPLGCRDRPLRRHALQLRILM